MPNLVGIGNSQVPTNAMLGGLAYQDSVGEINIEKIKARTSDTAIDQGLFVYDTRKDSDGGAWRKRTQHTSWYNEGANSDRGARKEFPAVAIIVAENDEVTIYDGDDPNCAMWMVFTAGGSNGTNMIGRTSEYTTCVKASNGMLCIGRMTFGLHVIDFITDKGHFKEAGYDTPYALPIGSHRNGGNKWIYSSGGGKHQLANDEVRTLDMKVMPNTPINPDRGIADPTIVVGTSSGMEAHLGLYNKLLFVTGTTSYNCEKIIFTEDGGLAAQLDSNATNNNGLVFARDYHHIHLLAWSTYTNWESVYYKYNYSSAAGKVSVIQGDTTDPTWRLAAMRGHDFALGTAEALNLISPEPIFNSSTTNADLVAYIRHTYNTGWMPRDTMVNNLNSTEVGINTSGANIFSNGTFDSNITGWQNWDTNRGSVTHNSGRMRFNNSGTGDVYAYGAFDHTLPPGTTFTVSGSYYSISGGNATNVQIYPYNEDLASFPDSGSLGTYADSNGTRASSYSFSGGADGTFHITTTVDSPGGATGVLLGLDPNSGTTFDLGNLTCTYTQGRLTDRTKPYGEDYVTFGTVTKTPVAEGAELMAFGGFSSSNYIRAGTNPNLEMGSGDFYYIFWVNPGESSSGQVLLSHWSRNVDSSNAGRVGIYFNSGNVRFDLTDDGGSSYQAIAGTNGIQDSNGWHMVCAIRRGHTAELWVDGKLDVSKQLNSTADGTYSNKKRIVEIGHSPNMGNADSGIKMALLRIGKTVAPTKEQIEKMYKDELQLFGKNAKCTLFGSAASITGLAFDDSTNVLHAGTSVGRSDFRGLVRINNTETPVPHDISASNGLIIEQ